MNVLWFTFVLGTVTLALGVDLRIGLGWCWKRVAMMKLSDPRNPR